MNNNSEKYNALFHEIFGVDDSVITSLEYKNSPEWNSMAHIALISAIEEEFSVNFEAEDIFEFTSYETGKDLLMRKFNVKFQ